MLGSPIASISTLVDPATGQVRQADLFDLLDFHRHSNIHIREGPRASVSFILLEKATPSSPGLSLLLMMSSQEDLV